jgi:ATP synthase subunit 6
LRLDTITVIIGLFLIWNKTNWKILKTKIKVLNFFFDPLEQFEILGFGGSHSGFSTLFSNLSIFMLLNAILLTAFLKLVYNRGTFNIWDLLLTSIYGLVKGILKSNINLKRSQYFSILFFLFTFIFLANLTGLIPYSFTATSSFVITFFLASTHFIGINLIGVTQHRWEIQNLFLPSGTPIGIAPVLVLIEFISYIARVFSLSIRLFANMVSGHTLLKILIGFSWALINAGSIYFFVAFLPWIIVTLIMFLETLIAFLQAYVFVVLITIYINDVLNLH